MPIAIGASKIKKLTLGTTPFKKVCIGSELIWSDNPNSYIMNTLNSSNIYGTRDNFATWTKYTGIYNSGSIYMCTIQNMGYDSGFYAGCSTATSSSVVGSPVIAVSDDGIVWSVITLPKSVKGLCTWCVFKQSNIILLSYDTYDSADKKGLMRSTDGGKTWVTVSSPSNNRFTSFAYGNGKLIGVNGAEGAVYYSTDWGTSWTYAYVYGFGSCDGVFFDRTQFLTYTTSSDTGNHGIYSSPDAVTWTARGGSKRPVLYGKIGNHYFGSLDQYLYVSSDLETWTNGRPLSGFYPNSVVFNGTDYFVLERGSSRTWIYKSSTPTDFTSYTQMGTSIAENCEHLTYSVDGGTL